MNIPPTWREVGLKGSVWFEIVCPTVTITIERRPPYCDRGSFLAKVFVTSPTELFVDEQDGWPRYYFDLERAKAECEAWLTKRKQL